ncbi:MAG: ATP-binding protein [Acidobacteriota bacterium]
MIIGCEASALSDFILSQYRERTTLQNHTIRALSDRCAMLAELVCEFTLTPLVFVGNSRCQDWKHLLQCCQPVLERASHSLIFSHEPLTKPPQRARELHLAANDALLGEWFVVVYSSEFAYLVLGQANTENDPGSVAMLLSLDREVIEASVDWLIKRATVLDSKLAPLAQEVVAMREHALNISADRRSNYLIRTIEKLLSHLNRIAIEHDRIEQEMETTLYKLTVFNSELAALNTVLERISRSLEPREIYHGVLKAVEIVDLEAVVILVLDESQQANLDFYGGATAQLVEAIKTISIEKFLNKEEPLPEELSVLYPEDESETQSIVELSRTVGIRTIVCIPLRSRNAIIGLMVLPSSSRRNFSTEDRRLLVNIGSQVGIAIESAMLYEKSQRLARQMGALFKVGKTISSQLELKPLFASIAENAGKLLDADHTSVVFLDYQSRQMSTIEWTVDGHSQTVNTTEISSPDRLIEEMMQSTLVQEASRSSLICFPIMVTERITAERRMVGTFCASRNPARNQPFTQSDLNLLNSLTSQVSIAVENAELYTKIVSANEQLREAIRLKDELVSMVAHDFRSPLTSIQALSELLQERIEDTEIKRLLSIINNQSKHLASLAADTLTMSRLESGNLPLKFKHFKINELVKSIVEARTLETSFDILLELPSEEIDIVGDAGRLYEVIDNLLGNAIKYSPDGVYVRIELAKISDGVQISITDKGIGIAPQDVSRLFQKFSRLDNARQRQISGTGLGLYICRSIIEAHGGRIWVESEPGKGSTFHLTLPFEGNPADDSKS